MIDLLLLAGVALCVISVLWAVVSLLRTEAPCGAAVTLVLGIVALFAGSALDERPFGIESLGQSWQRLVSGESFGTGSITVPPAAVTEDQGATDAPAASEPAPQAPMQGNGGEADPEAEPAAPGVEAPAATPEAAQLAQ